MIHNPRFGERRVIPCYRTPYNELKDPFNCNWRDGSLATADQCKRALTLDRQFAHCTRNTGWRLDDPENFLEDLPKSEGLSEAS
jgi:hypothetical protein